MPSKKIPYGISNFEILRSKNYLYVDKTKYIQILEEYAPYQFFIRPRRFGKSLFLSMIENYYDVNKEDKFDELFADLYIGKNPTKEKNSYLVWKISFSGIETGSGEEDLKKSFNQKVLLSAKDFVGKYMDILKKEDIPENITSSEMIVEYIKFITKSVSKQVFVLIDEYDNFANELITGKKNYTYESLIHGEGMVRAFYKALKEATMDNFTRIFMTGVSPIMLDDLTSGFNITENLTLKEKLNSMLGFTETELTSVLKYYEIYDSKIIKDMKKHYNGYLFSIDEEETVYNSDMVLYFIKELIERKKYPMNMIDSNVKTDYGRVNQLALNFKDEKTIEKILAEEQIKTVLVDRFNLSTMYSKKENFISLLYYLGMLTIKEQFEDQVILTIPNYVIRTIYWEQFYDILQRELKIDNEELKDCIRDMRTLGDISRFKEFFENILEGLSNRDLIGMNEKGIKMILMTLFGVDGTYMTLSEDENNNRYVDMLLKKKVQFEKYTNYEWLIELKYIKEAEREKIDVVKVEGLEQLEKYVESKKIKYGFKDEQLKKLLILVVGKKDVYIEEIL